jgi:tRNA(fMet)-specific endonuclease VapC
MSILDSGIVIEGIENRRFSASFVSVITLLELLRGVDDKKRPGYKCLLEETFPVLNIDNGTIEHYCRIYRALKQVGNLLPDADLLIAATAIAHDLTLETKDDHFQRLRAFGLRLK